MAKVQLQTSLLQPPPPKIAPSVIPSKAAVVLTGTYSVTSNVCTVTYTNHGMKAGMLVALTPTTGSLPQGIYLITSVTSNTAVMTVSSSNTSGATGIVPDWSNDYFVESTTNVFIGAYRARSYKFFWPDLQSLLPTMYVKYRVTDSDGPATSPWSAPTTFRYSFFDIYRREVVLPASPGQSANPWVKISTVYGYNTPSLIADWAGSVQYCICSTHPDNAPAPSEGLDQTNTFALASTISNPYVLYASDVLPTVVV
jgi:hypothetical protein